MLRLGALIVALNIAGAALVMVLFSMALGQERTTAIPESAFPTPEEAADIAKWIPASCCRTNNCCFKVSMSALTPMPQDAWKINASGQVLKRTGWTKDGQVWRCACDHLNGAWVSHLTANTRCIFPVMQSAAVAR